MKVIICGQLDTKFDKDLYCLSWSGNLEVYGSWDNWETPFPATLIKQNSTEYGFAILHVPYGTHQYKWKYSGTRLYCKWDYFVGFTQYNGEVWYNDCKTDVFPIVFDNGNRNQQIKINNELDYSLCMSQMIKYVRLEFRPYDYGFLPIFEAVVQQYNTEEILKTIYKSKYIPDIVEHIVKFLV